MVTTISAAPTTPVSWLFAPARSATAVREPLVLTGKPWKSPAARLAAPIPIISWLPSTSCPVRAANADDVEMVSASETSAMPSAPAASGREVGPARPGEGDGGKPCGSSPTSETPWAARSKTVGGGDREHDQDEDRRHLGQPRAGAPGRATSPRCPDRAAAGDRLAVGHAADEGPRFGEQAVASTLKPKSFGSWPTTIVTARPFM